MKKGEIYKLWGSIWKVEDINPAPFAITTLMCVSKPFEGVFLGVRLENEEGIVDFAELLGSPVNSPAGANEEDMPEPLKDLLKTLEGSGIPPASIKVVKLK